MQTQADLLQLPVEVYASPDATALGAAAFARLGHDAAAGARRRASNPGGRRRRTSPASAPTRPRSGWRSTERCRRGAADDPRVTVAGDRPGDYDVVVVGAGVVGCAVARELALRPWRVALLDASDDVGDGTSKANTAILHTGFDAAPGTLESRLVARGYALLSAYAAAAGIPVERVGALLVAWDEDQLAALPGLAEKAARNGYTATRQVDADELYAREPHLGPGALGALEVPDESIICPWTTTLAFATEALALGAELLLGTELAGGHPRAGGGHVPDHERRRASRTTYVVNAAGLRSDEVDRHVRPRRASRSRPRRGELVVFDKLARSLVSHILLPVPTARGKGVLVAPTVYGNVHARSDGRRPRRQDGDRHDGARAWRRCGVRGSASCRRCSTRRSRPPTPACARRPSTRDYQVELHADQGYVCVGGIRSTGLTASLALAEHVVELMAEAGLDDWRAPPVRCRRPCRTSARRSRGPTPEPERVAADPDYGRIVCHCERVTLGRDPRRARGPDPASDGGRVCGGGPGRGWGAARASSAAPPWRPCCRGGRRVEAGVVSSGTRPTADRFEDCDVLVVGGGPAGLAVAERLARRGRRVRGGARPRGRGRRHPAALPPHGVRPA